MGPVQEGGGGVPGGLTGPNLVSTYVIVAPRTLISQLIKFPP